MPGETNLEGLLKNMSPKIIDGEFVFCTVQSSKLLELDVNPIGQFHEKEGTTLILRKEAAESAGLNYSFRSRIITLEVHSSLDAVGLLAAITNRLAESEISVNAISAYFHDHLFVPIDKAEEALRILKSFNTSAV